MAVAGADHGEAEASIGGWHMAEPQPRHEASPSTTPDIRDAAGGTQIGEPLKTAAEVAAARLTETVEEECTTAKARTGTCQYRGGSRSREPWQA